MNAQVSQNHLTYVAPSALSPAGTAFAPAPRWRERAVAWLADIGQRLADVPHRRAVVNELSALSDHELADIGLARADLSRVFDPAFARQRRGA